MASICTTRGSQGDGILLEGKCGPAIGVGYSGTGILLDKNEGPLIIEVNAPRGIEIQNICQIGLKAQMAAVGEDFR